MPAGEQPAATGHSEHSIVAALTRSSAVKRRATELTVNYVRRPSGPFAKLGIFSSAGDEVSGQPEGSAGARKQGAIVQAKQGAITQSKSHPRPGPGPATTKDETDTVERGFKEALRKYESEAKSKYKIKIDPDHPHTVDELLKVVDDAVKDHRAKEDRRGIWGRIHHAFHKLGEARDIIGSWLGLLPSQSHYMSVVCGGLMLIIQIAARVKEISDRVLEGLEQIPTILDGARRVLHLFHESETLRARSSTLYLTILAALGHILDYLRQRTVRKQFLLAVAAVLTQESFESGLTDKIAAISAVRDSFNDEAELCHKEAEHERNMAIGEQIQGLQKLLEEANKEKLRSINAIEQYNDRLGNTEIKLDTIIEYLLELLKSSQKLDDKAEQDCSLLDTDEDEPELKLSRRESTINVLKGRKTPPNLSQYRKRLLGRLSYDAEVISADLKATFAVGPRLVGKDQNRVVYTIKSPKLADFVRTDESTILVINGRSQSIGRTSPLSFVAARFVLALAELTSVAVPSLPSSKRKPPPVIPLQFFCGQHRPRTEQGSPAEVAKSLLAQLVSRCRSTDLADVHALGKFNSSSVKAVFARFKTALAAGLPPDAMVFCVVDGLSTYVADRDTGKDARWLVAALARLAKKKPRKGPMFKVMLTAGHHLDVRDMYEKLPESAVLNLPEGPSLHASGDFQSMGWHFGIGPQMSGLGLGRW